MKNLDFEGGEGISKTLPQTTLLQTEFVFELLVVVDPIVDLGDGPLGRRKMVPIRSGTFSGPEIKGTVEAGGIDWQLVRPDGVTIIEAHYSLRTDDGALIRVINKGFRHGPAEVMKRLAQGDPVDPSEYYFRAAPILEAPTGRYGWMNSSLFVSSGVRQPDAVALRFYRIL